MFMVSPTIGLAVASLLWVTAARMTYNAMKPDWYCYPGVNRK
jgi:hypothetical protein